MSTTGDPAVIIGRLHLIELSNWVEALEMLLLALAEELDAQLD